MQLQYDFILLHKGISEFCFDECRYWIILSGDGQISYDDNKINLINHDVLEIPVGFSFKLDCQSPMHIGVIIITDFQPGNKYLQVKNHTDTELIRRVFFFAVEFIGFRHDAMEHLQYYINMLMYEALARTGLETYQINPQIAKALNELNLQYLDPALDMEKIIAVSGYSRSHFHKLFRETTGVSPKGYIHEKRIDRARLLLRQSEGIPVNVVASMCGYTDVFYFSRIFRKITGMSPSEYASQTP